MSKSLMLIESDVGLADAVRRALQPAGVSVTTVPAGEQALERVKAAPPDLILLAAELPDMSGFSVCNRIKRAFAQVPLIVYTSEATAAAVEAHKASRTHADDYLTKPFEVSDLVSRAARLLQVSTNGHGGGGNGAQGAEAPLPEGDEALQLADDEVMEAEAIEGDEALPQGDGADDGEPLAVVGKPISAPPPAPGPPKIPERHRTERREIPDVFAEWPRDPAPPKGSPEEKLDFFRDRIRVKEQFIGRVKEVFTLARAEANEAHGENEALRRDLEAAAQGRAELERTLRDMRDGQNELRAKMNDVERRLKESEGARKMMSEVLNEAIQEKEKSDQQWSLRVASAEEQSAKLEQQRREDRLGFEQALDAKRMEWEGEKADLDRRAQLLQEELDALAAQNAEAKANLEQLQAQLDQARQQSAQELAQLHQAHEEAQSRASELSGELAEAKGQGEALTQRVAELESFVERLEKQVAQSKAEANAFSERALAAEQLVQAKDQELAAIRKQAQDLAAALDQKSGAERGVRGEVQKLHSELQKAQQREAAVKSEREQLAQRVAQLDEQIEAAKVEAGRLENEAAALKLQAQQGGGDAARLKRQLARAEEIVEQKTREADAAKKQAHQAGQERERVQDELAGQIASIASDGAKKDSEIAALKRKLAEAARPGAGGDAARAAAELDAQRRAHIQEMVDVERRHVAEVSRLKAAMMELEKHLEARSRTEVQLKKRLAELEQAQVTDVHRIPQDLNAALQGAGDEAGKLKEELSETREEVDFLNSEVARYHQKNKELAAEIQRLKGK